jgi:rhodanese-related sulfurtransferase
VDRFVLRTGLEWSGIDEKGRSAMRAVDMDGVQRLLEEGVAQLVEVLPREEYEEEHLPGAINIPLKELDARGVARLPKDAPVIVYCHDYQ